MELFFLCMPELPESITPDETKKFIDFISKKIYPNPQTDPSSGWSQIRPRQITIWDFTIPSSIEKQVLADLKPYIGGTIDGVSKIFEQPIVGPIISKVTGIKPIDLSNIKATNPDKKFGVRLGLIGKREDGYTRNGVELL